MLVVGCGSLAVPSSNSFFIRTVLSTLERELIRMEIISGSEFTQNTNDAVVSSISRVVVTCALDNNYVDDAPAHYLYETPYLTGATSEDADLKNTTLKFHFLAGNIFLC